ncbi:MAG: orotidine-5'-phosphate decarboxylase [Jiangellales bacterium]
MGRRRDTRDRVMAPFGSRLRAGRGARGPLCVGLDPHPQLLAAWGLHDDVAGVEVFARTVTDALADRVCLIKPQLAFFERHGSRGMAVLEQVVVDARSAGALVLLDAKRGDIGSTMQAYAEAFLDPRSAFAADAMTVSPYLGVGALRPAFDLAAKHQAGVFVLARTSNPEGASLQAALLADGRSVAQTVLDAVAVENAEHAPWGSIGVVVGATLDQPVTGLDVGGPVLAPGIGAQGAQVGDLPRVFGEARSSVYPVSARGVLGAGPNVGDLRAAAQALNHECADVLG